MFSYETLAPVKESCVADSQSPEGDHRCTLMGTVKQIHLNSHTTNVNINEPDSHWAKLTEEGSLTSTTNNSL